MIRIIGAALLVAGFAFIGFDASNRLKKRVKVIGGLIQALEVLSAEITYNLSPVGQAVASAALAAGEASPFFADCKARLEKEGSSRFEECWLKSAEKLECDEGTKEIAASLAGVIGKYEAAEQAKAIEYAVSRLKKRLEEAEEERKRSSKVYMTLGVSCGITAAIIFI
ncbi:MAG: stage III sporulation protein AB [Oscillospiraceae bacterium]|jgi:stage III sporulation protein AB|nr:stage III sporulation protein AB [Oscillospiraceae bacterium]